MGPYKYFIDCHSSCAACRLTLPSDCFYIGHTWGRLEDRVSMRVVPDPVFCAASYLQGVCRKAGSSWGVFLPLRVKPPQLYIFHISGAFMRAVSILSLNTPLLLKYPIKEINTTEQKFTDNNITAGFLVDIIMSFNKSRAFWNISLCGQDRFLSCITVIQKELIKENKTDWQCCAANRQRRNWVFFWVAALKIYHLAIIEINVTG